MEHMVFRSWYTSRGYKFLWQRVTKLLSRYNLTPQKAVKRVENCLCSLIELGGNPTFPTPGIIIQRHAGFIQNLQGLGAEIAVHGYQHVDLSTYPITDARRQLQKAIEIFERFGIEVHGFRCPYVGYSDQLLEALPADWFEYSSNNTIYWDHPRIKNGRNGNIVYEKLCGFYRAKPSTEEVSVPWNRQNMLELPISMPDDLQLYDGLGLSPKDVFNIWRFILIQTHLRGELFNLIFHPELAALCQQSILDVLEESKKLKPSVWIAKLHEISSWWNEKSTYSVRSELNADRIKISFDCTHRATILAKGIAPLDSWSYWAGPYYRVPASPIEMPAKVRPFIGVYYDVPEQTVSFLEEQGYLLDTSALAPLCSIYLDATKLSELKNKLELINYIEALPGPLIRYWRWPDAAKSALCITGDLDALSLADYFTRLYMR